MSLSPASECGGMKYTVKAEDAEEETYLVGKIPKFLNSCEIQVMSLGRD